MSRTTVLWMLLVAALLTSSCGTGQVYVWIYDEENLPETRGELYKRFGPPDQIRWDGDIRILRYDEVRGKGITFGAAPYGARFVIGRNHSVSNKVWVRVGPDDKIRTFSPHPTTSAHEYRLWPFGD